MKAAEYDKINPYFRNEILKYEEKCIESNISINICYNDLMYKFQKYYNAKNYIKIVERLDFKDKFKTKVLLGKAFFYTKEYEIEQAIKKFEYIKKDLFEWLNKTKDPYFFILYPFYKFGLGINYKDVPYKADNSSGIKNLEIAVDYAKYKFNENI